ncbi:Otoferlin [Eumeta japonica]|uniref:Otoferlin n=1 Tax=Eumeta variegata TaxID=151549 RepID=A0A4C1THD4_EUMVA|nr:Otoferlin [Eumeta japonica]
MRAYVYQARSLIGSDSSGLSDPFASVIIGDQTESTLVIDETLSPTWDELLLFNDVLIYGTMENIKLDPPTIVIEIFDQDKVGKSEFIGRTIAKPHVKAFEEPYERPHFPPSLEWYEITRGDDRAGELLATFELLEIPLKQDRSILPELPSPRTPCGKTPFETEKETVLPVPAGIRPTLSKYRIEVLFWGLRDLKRIHLLTVDKPRVDIECAGNILYSSVIQNAKRNPNFTNPVKFVDVELPDQDLYRPPLTIRVIDCRSFGRITLVGTHTINSIHKYIYTPICKKDKEAEERKKSLIQLQNVDLVNNCIISEDTVTVENEKENWPLLMREGRSAVSYGSGVKVISKRASKRELNKKRKESTESAFDDDEGSKDWWTKYFASIEAMIEEEKEAKKERQGVLTPSEHKMMNHMLAEMKYIHMNWKLYLNLTISKNGCIRLNSIEEKTGDDSEDESRIVGVFKGAIKVYKWPLPKGIEDHTVMGFDPNFGFFQGVPNNEPIHVLVRVYIVKATDLHPMDLNGKADPYIVLHLGSKRISDKEHYVSKQLNPVFGKCFEIEATFPQDSNLIIQVLDWDLLGSDDMIGETRIDLENRFYSRHRATCGLAKRYEEIGKTFQASNKDVLRCGSTFPHGHAAARAPVDISPRKPKSFEMRVIIWNTDDVVLEDDAFFSGGSRPDDCQTTDIHYRSLTGEGNFNWRFIYPFDYLEAEEKIVISRKESVFSWDESECKIPARLELQVWDMTISQRTTLG